MPLLPMTSHIPEDIERLIVEAFVESVVSDSFTNLQPILLTCKRFSQWSYPIIYHSIFLPRPEQLRLLIQTLSEAPSLAGLVKILTLPDEPELYGDVRHLIILCDNLYSLACWMPTIYDPALPPFELPANTLRRLSLDLNILSASQHSIYAALAHLTHLDICGSNAFQWYPVVSTLNTLTHLMLPVPNFYAATPEIAQLPICLKLPRLKVCILFKFAPTNFNWLVSAKYLASGELDPRIVVGAFSLLEGNDPPFPYIASGASKILSGWRGRDQDPPDVWDRAEEILRARSSLARAKGVSMES